MSNRKNWNNHDQINVGTKNERGQVLIEALISLATLLLFVSLSAEICKMTLAELQKIRYSERSSHVQPHH